MAASRVLLRQVLTHHGHSVPCLPVGGIREWLPMLPGSALVNAMDACTVVLPRPGDGWYAPPPGSGVEAAAGFPWGELTTQGADSMRAFGQNLVARFGGERWNTSHMLVRSANRPACVASAQAVVLGAQEAARVHPQPHGSGASLPVEVLLQQGEDLVPNIGPASPDYPRLDGQLGIAFEDTERQMALLFAEATSALQDLGYGISAEALGLPEHASLDTASTSWTRDLQWGLFCELLDAMLVPLEARKQSLPQALSKERLDGMRRFAFLRCAGPLHQAAARQDADAAQAVVGPLLREMFIKCDNVPTPASPAGLVLYSTQADALVSVLGALGLAGELSASNGFSWPSFGTTLEVELIEDNAELFLRFEYNGVPLVPGLGRELIPYTLLRKRFAF